jgi:hypothetical protein
MDTVKRIILLVQFMEQNQQLMDAFAAYKQDII